MNFQRKGAPSNTHVGKDFEARAKEFLETQGIILQPNFTLEIGINENRKKHNFDFGDREKKIIVECKSHTWTESGNVPSAKITTWNQAMYFFLAASSDYRKILLVLHDVNKKTGETLGEYYLRTNAHLIPDGVEIWEFDDNSNIAKKIN